MMSVPLEGPWPSEVVTFEPEWPLGAFFGLAVFGTDTYGVTVIPSLEVNWSQGFILGSATLGAAGLGASGWGVALEPPWS